MSDRQVFPPMAAVLMLSLLVNGVLAFALSDAKGAARVAELQRKTAVSAAEACSDSVDALQKAAVEREAVARPRVESARQGAQRAAERALSIQTAPPAVTGDDCASARVAVDGWLAGRSTAP